MNICACVKPLTCSPAHDASVCGAGYRDERVSGVRSRDLGSPSGIASSAAAHEGVVYPWSACGAAWRKRSLGTASDGISMECLWCCPRASMVLVPQGRPWAARGRSAAQSIDPTRFPLALETRKEPVSSLWFAEWPVSGAEWSSALEHAPQPPHGTPKRLPERDMSPKRTIE